MRGLAGVIAALALGAAAVAQAAPSAADKTAIAAYEARLGPNDSPLAARMAELHVPGVSIAFIEGGRVKWARAYGVATAGGPKATPATLFQAASMSKAVAAATALRLADRGRLDLDQDVNARLRAWKVPESPFTAEAKVTMRGLLSHTAGLTVGGFPGYAAGKPVPSTVQVLDGAPPANTPAVRSWEAPGRYAYSGGGYTVAQLLIAEVGGEPYPDLAERLVLRPAGMTASTMAQPLPERLIPKAASGHDARGQVIPGARNTYPEYAAAGLWTTPSDYGRFLITVQESWTGRRGALLSAASAKAMVTPVDASAGYGLGLLTGRRGGHPYVTHGGSNEGFRCDSLAFLDGSRQGVVVMTNGDNGSRLAGEILAALGRAYGWGPPDPDNKASTRRAPFIAPR
ncbi:MAG: beta-lactamase family protein [Phenylobacterium sp.]|nr:beta-lactamase family protein [Phenylobacterium sp.]